MRFLFDEQLSERAAHAWSALIASKGHVAVHIYDLGAGGTDDDDIPELCKSNHIQTLVTMNVKDFGAKKHYYTSLTASGIHVVVVRPGKKQPEAGQQLAIIAQHATYIEEHLAAATTPTLIKVTFSSAGERTLAELVSEVGGLP